MGRLPKCSSGKKRFAFEGDAQKAANRMQARSGEPFGWYKCRECSFWHIGHQRTAAEVEARRARKAAAARPEPSLQRKLAF